MGKTMLLTIIESWKFLLESVDHLPKSQKGKFQENTSRDQLWRGCFPYLPHFGK
jgi:hypothetical protein